MDKARLREYSFWLAVFTATAVFQFWRASELDGLIFIAIIAALTISLVDTRGFTTYGGSHRYRRWGTIYLIAIVTLLAFSRIHTLPAMAALLAAVPLLLLSRERHSRHHHPREAIIRSTLIWGAFTVAVGLWELLSYITGEVSGDDKKTPTISMLVDPFLHHSAGRITFVVLWGFVGYELLFHRKGR
jgi:hypothetical protein